MVLEKEEEKVEPEELKKTPKRISKKVELDPELVAAKKRDHEIKVAKFLAGGKF